MAKKPLSAYTKKQVVKSKTFRDWVIIGIYIILAVALVATLLVPLFGQTTHGGF